MTGLDTLQKLPTEIKTKISIEWGSVTTFYQTVFDLYAQDYKLAKQKPIGYQQHRQEVQNSLHEIQGKLESFGVDDGSDITIDILNDHAEIIGAQNIQNLDNYLRQFGTDFETMRKWMKDKYGI